MCHHEQKDNKLEKGKRLFMANIITISRIFIALFAIILLFFTGVKTYILAFVLTAIAIWFDGLDGYVARKFNETSKFGAMLDILGDRIVENIYWISFVALGWLNVVFPLVVVTRGILTDGVRSLAFEKGYTAFGSTTMMKSKLGKFIVASNFSRFTYAVTKALAFGLLILAHLPIEYACKQGVSNVAYACAYISLVFCVVRGLPVLIESKRFFKNS